MKAVGTILVGVKAPIIKAGDNLVDIVVDSVINACTEQGLALRDRDIVGVTEAVLGKSQRNFATLEQIASDVSKKFGNETVGLIFPIMSRNRFALVLKAISMGVKKLIVQLSYPFDEVGNPLIDESKIYEKNINRFVDEFSAEEFYNTFGKISHPFTGVDYIAYYKEIAGEDSEIILSNRLDTMVERTPYIINADIHTRFLTKQQLLNLGAKKVVSLDEILSSSVDGSGYNTEFGLLGSNVSTDNSVKLFPRNSQDFVEELALAFKNRTGKNIECLVYGDGAFKDPVGGIWELADPVVAPGFTAGLKGSPSEIKLKYVADNQLGNLSGDEAKNAMIKIIENKNNEGKSANVSLGTTPRRYVDLLGSLCDLTSGSGDKGTPIVLIKNYFDTFAD